MTNNTTRKITFIGLMSAVIAVLSQITFPLPSGVPVTLQTFAVALCGYMLSYKYGLSAVGIYILLGAVGVPVFSGFKGGIGILFSVTGGFIYGFLPLGFLCGIASKSNQFIALASGFAGLVICHALGTLQYALISQIPFAAAFIKVSLPFIVKDVLSIAAAYYIYRLIAKRKNLKFN